MDKAMTGTIWGLGIGPGDPDLITLKALRILQNSSVIAYPALDTGASLVRRIADPHITHAPEEIAFRIEMGQDAGPVYDRTAAHIARIARKGTDIAVLCEGDPLFYGSFMYLSGRLGEMGLCVKTVPGVSSLTACAAAAGIPLSARNDILKILPAPLCDARLERECAGGDGFVIIKLGRHFSRIRPLLDRLGLLENARLIERASQQHQKVAYVKDIPQDADIPYFSMIISHRYAKVWR